MLRLVIGLKNSRHFLNQEVTVYTRFQCYVHSGYLYMYLSTSFDSHLSTSSFAVLLEISQSQLIHADVCFMSLLCKLATSSKGHASGLWLADFDLSCLQSMSKDGRRKISAMHVTLKAGISQNQSQAKPISIVTSSCKFSRASCNCFDFWLDNRLLCVLCDWPELLLWFWLYGTQLKTALVRFVIGLTLANFWFQPIRSKPKPIVWHPRTFICFESWLDNGFERVLCVWCDNFGFGFTEVN